MKEYFLSEVIRSRNVDNSGKMQEELDALRTFYERGETEAYKPQIPDEVIESTFRPIADWMLVRLDRALDKTGGGLHLPRSAQPKPRHGYVISCGKGVPIQPIVVDGKMVREYPMDCVPGDFVVIDVATTGRRIPGNSHYALYRQGNVAAILSSNVFSTWGVNSSIIDED